MPHLLKPSVALGGKMYYKKKKFGYKPRAGYKRKKVIRKRNATIIVIPRKRRW